VSQPDVRTPMPAVEGVVHPITYYGDPVLHQRCAEVTDFGPDLEQLIADMFISMAAADGVGLAANQIGVSLRVFIVDCPDESETNVIAHVVNPVVLKGDKERSLDDDVEGCLSVPGPHAYLARPDFAVVEGVDMHGEPVRIEGTGLLARCLQHETDHLEGIVYVDRLDKRTRKQVLAEADFSS
jgi:peptide deformylase